VRYNDPKIVIGCVAASRGPIRLDHSWNSGVDRPWILKVGVLEWSIPLRLFLELINLDVTSWLMTIIKDHHNMASNIPHDQNNRFIQIRHRAR
jgi:hypothetical protein